MIHGSNIVHTWVRYCSYMNISVRFGSYMIISQAPGRRTCIAYLGETDNGATACNWGIDPEGDIYFKSTLSVISTNCDC